MSSFKGRLQFDEALEKIIATEAEVSSERDSAILDSPDFDPTRYINSIFPTGEFGFFFFSK